MTGTKKTLVIGLFSAAALLMQPLTFGGSMALAATGADRGAADTGTGASGANAGGGSSSLGASSSDTSGGGSASTGKGAVGAGGIHKCRCARSPGSPTCGP